MDEIANQFKEEYTELLSRYKEHLTNAQIMSILQSLTRKQIGFKDMFLEWSLFICRGLTVV